MEDPVSNTVKAVKENFKGGEVAQTLQQARRGPLAVQEDDIDATGHDNTSRGSFESIPRRSPVGSISSSRRGSRMNAFGWIAGKIGLGEARSEAETEQVGGFSRSGHEREVHSVLGERATQALAPANDPDVPEEPHLGPQKPTPEVTNYVGEEESPEPVSTAADLTRITLAEVPADYSEAERRTPVRTLDPSYEASSSEEADGASNGDAAEDDIPRNLSTESSLAGSYVESTAAPGSSEATLEIVSEDHYEQQDIQRANDKYDNEGLGAELPGIDSIPGEGTEAEDNAAISNQLEHPPSPTAEPIETSFSESNDKSWDLAPEQASPKASLDLGREIPMPMDYGNNLHEDSHREHDSPAQEATRSPPFDEAPTVEDEHSVIPEMGVAPETPVTLAPSVYNPTDSENSESRRGSDIVASPLERRESGLHGSSPDVHEGLHDGVALGSSSDSGEAMSESSGESAEKVSIQDIEPNNEDSMLHDAEEHLPVTTPSHVAKFSSEDYSRALTTEGKAEEEDNTNMLCVDENSDSMINFDTFSHPHETHPVVLQIGNGTWCKDPTEEEFEATWIISREPAIPISPQSHCPSEGDLPDQDSHSNEELHMKSMTLEAQPVSMQLPNGLWATDPSEDEYNTQALLLPSDTDDVTVAADAEPTLDPDIRCDDPAEKFVSQTHTREEHTLDTESRRRSYPETVHLESVSSTRVEDLSGREETLSVEGSDGLSANDLADIDSQEPMNGSSQSAHAHKPSLPWSPFNSRAPLSPEAPQTTADQSSHSYGVSDAESTQGRDATHLSDRHATFGFGKNPESPYEGAYQVPDIPSSQALHPDTLSVADPTTDTESQNFVTPLQSAGLETPPLFQDHQATAGGSHSTSRNNSPQGETATTVHGQDELFDSDSTSEYEPDPRIDENGDPRANLGMPPQHHALAHTEDAVESPTTAILQPEAEMLDENTSEMLSGLEENGDVSPLSLRDAVPPPKNPRRGLASSRHNPDRPVTPPSQTIPEDLGSHESSWGASGPIDSTPMSLVSHSTLSSSPYSPVREKAPEGPEPAIQDAWSEDIHEYQQRSQHYYEDEHQTTLVHGAKLDSNLPTPIATHIPESMRGHHSPATPSPSTLIQKMRGIFENASQSSPVRSRPSSGAFSARPLESPGYDISGEPRRGGFLNEVEDDIDERSALLGSVERH